MKTRPAFILPLAISICFVLFFPLSADADQDPYDPFAADTVIIRPSSIQVPGPPWPDSVGIDVFYWGDEDVASFSFGFDLSGFISGGGNVDDYLSMSSFSHDGANLPSNWIWTPVTLNEAENQILFGALDFSGTTPWNPPVSKLGRIWIEVAPELPSGSVATLDSSWVAPGGNFISAVLVLELGAVSITPRFANGSETGLPTLIFGSLLCGDADGDGTVNISDATFLVQYIFAGGPAPVPLSRGDADCSSQANLTDVIYLIQYIFAGGPAPCDPNGNGAPDC